MDLGNTRKNHANQLVKVAILLLGVFAMMNEVYAEPGVGRSGRWFTYNDQPTYLVGYDLQQLVSDQSIDIPATLQKLADFRINKIRVWTYCWFMGGAGLTPWQKVSGVHNLDAWDNVGYWPRMRALAAEARARDIIVEVTIFSPYPNMTNYWWDSPSFSNAWNKTFNRNLAFSSNANGHFYPEFYNLSYGETSSQGKTLRTYQQALVDKVVAELGSFDNVYFEVANEFAPEHADLNSSSAVVEWQREWARRIDTTSSRLVATHSEVTDRSGEAFLGVELWADQAYIDVLNFRLISVFNGNIPQGISDLLANKVVNHRRLQTLEKILAINETASNSPYWGTTDFYTNLDAHTQYAWGMFISGGHIGFYLGNPRDILDEPGWVAGANRLKALRDIAETVRFWEMSPVDGDGNEYDSLIRQGPAGSNWQVLANPGSQYVAYFWGKPSNTNVVVNLPGGRYSYDWYDVRNMNVLGTGTVTGSGNTVIVSPAPASWNGNSGLALTIKSVGGAAP
jgi:hypothetical protein